MKSSEVGLASGRAEKKKDTQVILSGVVRNPSLLSARFIVR